MREAGTEDEFWLNELKSDKAVRAGLSSALTKGLVVVMVKGEAVSTADALAIIGRDESWEDPGISFLATKEGRDAYFGLGPEAYNDLRRRATELENS